jgi:ribosome production factor 2
MAPTEQQIRQNKTAQLAGKKKQPKARIQRYLQSVTQSQLRELGAKQTLLLKGRNVSANMTSLLQELRAIQAPASKLLNKKNPIDLFNASGNHSSSAIPGMKTNGDGGAQSLEFLMTKNDCSLFVMATHNKKRPNNLLIGRTFDRQLLDTAELGITYYKSAMRGTGDGTDTPKKRIGSKPLLLFLGDIWQNVMDYINLRSLLIDFYRGDVVDKLVVSGLDHIIVFTAASPTMQATTSLKDANTKIQIHQRTYHMQLKKNPNPSSDGSSIPLACLTSSGPDLDFVLRRTSWADKELASTSRIQPRSAASKNKRDSSSSVRSRKKNQSTNLLGETIGRIHLKKQDVDKIGGRKVKALRRAEKAERLEEQMAVENDLAHESEAIGKEFQTTFGFSESK